MIESFILVGIVIALIMLGRLLFRQPPPTDFSPLLARLETLEKLHNHAEQNLMAAIDHARKATEEQSHGLREELQHTLKNTSDSLVQSVDGISKTQHQRLESFASQLNAFKQSSELGSSTLRDGLSNEFKNLRESLQQQMQQVTAFQKQQLDSFAIQISALTDKNEKKFDELRQSVENKLAQLQADNSSKLDEMRRTVDEKLQGTLEKRLGESFKLVSERLEQVHKGLGEMQTLASGVGDLKRVLTNIKTRGNWGEVQLGNLLEQILTPEQFSRNVQTKPNSRENVEFAIKLPGKGDDNESPVWLPIDAKFPKEDYERLVDASERNDETAVAQAGKDLENRIRNQARDIHDKYILPPNTTDFGLMYLPTEGLYAEVLRRPGLVDSMQRNFRVVIVGPTSLAALLNSLQMGFRTLAIQKRSSEVWKVLAAVKTEFSKFGDALDKVKKKLDETSNTIDDAANRSRQLEKKLRRVEALPSTEASVLLEEDFSTSESNAEHSKMVDGEN